MIVARGLTLHDAVDRFADGRDRFGFFILDLDFELFFDIHDELDYIEGVGTELFK